MKPCTLLFDQQWTPKSSAKRIIVTAVTMILLIKITNSKEISQLTLIPIVVKLWTRPDIRQLTAVSSLSGELLTCPIYYPLAFTCSLSFNINQRMVGNVKGISRLQDKQVSTIPQGDTAMTPPTSKGNQWLGMWCSGLFWAPPPSVVFVFFIFFCIFGHQTNGIVSRLKVRLISLHSLPLDSPLPPSAHPSSCLRRLFGVTGNCAACSKLIPAFEMVMRARDNVYHLDCFACQLCRQR